MSDLNLFTGLYPVSKTLRFELKPVGKTLDNIIKSGILDQDQTRACHYKHVKKLIDQYHKQFIECALTDFKLKYESDDKKDSLWEYYFYYKLGNRDEKQTADYKKVQANLRTQISKRFSSMDAFKHIDKEELIKEKLQEFLTSVEDKNIVKEFSNFTTYFVGFHENRKNMYVAEEKSTAIAYRLINQNLPKFIDNIDIFGKVLQTSVRENLKQLYSDFEEYLNVRSIEEIFRLDYFTDMLTQTQIDVYNAIIGGKTLPDATKIQGLNEYINLFNQKQSDKKCRLPKLKPMFKQILSDRNAISFLPEEFSSDNEMLESIEKCYEDINSHIFCDGGSEDHNLKSLLISLSEYDLYKIYIKNDTSITDISQKMFGGWGTIHKAIGEDFVRKNNKKPKETMEAYEQRKDVYVKSFDSLSIGYINDCLKNIGLENANVASYFSNLGAVNTELKQKENLFAQILNAYTAVASLLNTPYPEQKNLAQDKVNVEKIKSLLDSFKELQFFIKPLLGCGNESDKDERFYASLSAIWDVLDQITPLYNKVRNRMTRKPYSTEKIKLNFENSQLLNGWDLNKERDNTCVILRKEGLYYLGIMNKKHNAVFKPESIKSDGDCYEKMEYKLLPGANKMLPKVFFSKSRKDEFKPSEEIVTNYNNETHKKGDKFNIRHCHQLIDFFKASIEKHEDWKNFGFKFSETSTYEDLSGFYREVEQQGYMMSFRNVSADYINDLVADGKLYLFQIYNKDFSPFSKGTPNMHTLYWKMLFDEKNLSDVVYKLNGQAEVFYRKSSIDAQDTIKHLANKPIDNKNTLNQKQQSIFTYDLIKDRRFTVDKFQFHVPITMNFKSVGKNMINANVNEFIRKGGVEHIIGIDRGERHLLYLTVIDLKGRIKEQYTLNEIINEYNGNTYKTNYHDLLDKREGARLRARQDWNTIENIKDLKQGYLSQVVHKIADLMVKYKAIVVLEDLNSGFMKSRQKVEKSVYQQFEKMLIDKLNYLVDKKADVSQPGGLLKAYQLTSKFDSFQKLGKQSGFLFYVPAWNTSKMDPTTGFVNLFDTRYENVDKSKLFFSLFEKISYNKSKGWFEFSVNDYSRFNAKATDTRQNWVVCSWGTRIETFRNPEKNSEWDSKEIVITEAYKKLFEEYKIDINGNLKESICAQKDKSFFEQLLHLFHLTLQMRNSVTGTEVDYLISPVANKKGDFYDSRLCKEDLPANADANGAFNIARKGLWALERIKQSKEGDKISLAITNKEWLQYIQSFDK